jgi:hypothetical protein
LATGLGAALAGCGFVGAARAADHKPDTFVLHGLVAVPVPNSDPRPAGAACAATLPGIVGGAPVRVTDPAGHLLGTGALSDGLIERDGATGSCGFAFQIQAVGGGVASYDISVAGRPPQRFPARNLRENALAVLTITG